MASQKTSQRERERDEARAARRERERALQVEAVEALRSSAGWQRWLRTRGRFRRYSLGNQLLIALQSAASNDTFCVPRSQSLEVQSAPWPLLSPGALSSLTTTRMLRIRIDDTPGRLVAVWYRGQVPQTQRASILTRVALTARSR